MKKIFGKIRLFWQMARAPKRLVLRQDQAEYVRDLFLGGADPEGIGRAMDKTYGRKTFPYFKVPNEEGTALEFGTADYEIDGLEYLNAALWHPAIGAIAKRGKEYYYVNDNPMIQRIAAAASTMPIPQGGKRGTD